jgi:hypothetical protein
MAYTVRKIKTRYGTEYGVYDRGSLVRTEATKAAAKATAAYYRKAEKGNPAPKSGRLKPNTWVRAHRVRLVKKNGRHSLEIQRITLARKKRKR